MDYCHITETFELGKLISTARKGIPNLIKLQSLITKYCGKYDSVVIHRLAELVARSCTKSANDRSAQAQF